MAKIIKRTTYLLILTGIAFFILNKQIFKTPSASLAASHEYELKFTPEKTPPGHMNEYIPRYRPADTETVRLYGGLFGMQEGFGEDDTCFWLEDSSGQLYIDKYINRIRYTPVPRKEKTIPLTSDNEAIEQALAFFEEKLLHIGYEEALVLFDGQQYEILFVNRLANIKNYAFNDRIVMDRYGNLEELAYHYIVYDKLNNTPIKSMATAYDELPQGLLDDRTVDLKNGELVYMYENSIVQPAYLFEGEVTGGSPQSYRCFIKASVYE